MQPNSGRCLAGANFIQQNQISEEIYRLKRLGLIITPSARKNPPLSIDRRQVSTVTFQEIIKKDFNEEDLPSFSLILPVWHNYFVLCIYRHTSPQIWDPVSINEGTHGLEPLSHQDMEADSTQSPFV